jgi:hypothetical protein
MDIFARRLSAKQLRIFMDEKIKQKLDESASVPRANWLTHDEMIAALQSAYPGTEHGKDYTIAMMVSPNSNTQLTSAFIMKWNLPEAEPTPAALHAKIGPHAANARTSVKAKYARAERDHRLTKSDAIITRAIEEGDANKQKNVSAYRQSLRDLPLQAGFPHKITWPVAPV